MLEAAGTKWNFLKFKPGLVGGHCIGVDPYYLAQKAQEAGYYPEIILAGRRVNDGMGAYVAGEVIKLMVKKEISIKDSKILILGITFKENCTDIRNTKVADIVNKLLDYHADVTVFDPWANTEEVYLEYKIRSLQQLDKTNKYDAIILAVAHDQFTSINYKALCKEPSVVYDVKSIIRRDWVDARL